MKLDLSVPINYVPNFATKGAYDQDIDADD